MNGSPSCSVDSLSPPSTLRCSGQSRFASSALIGFLLAAAIGLFYLLTIRPGHVWGDDHAAYISHARNLVEGHAYGDTGFIRTPSSINPQMYPPGFPLLLAPVYKLFGLNLTPMKILGIGFFSLALWLFHLLARIRGPGWAASIAVFIIGVSPYFWDFKDSVFSEFPFLAFTYGAMLVARLAMGAQRKPLERAVGGIAAGFLCAAACTIRSPGIVLIPAILIADAWPRRRPSWFSAYLIAAFLLLTVLVKLRFAVQSDYLGPLLRTFSFRDFCSGIINYLLSFSVIWGDSHGFLSRLLFVIAWVFACLGFASLFRNGIQVEELFFLFYLMLIVIFPWGGRRYLMPILPFFVHYVLVGFNVIIRRLPRPAAGLLAFASLTLFAGCVAMKYSTFDFHRVSNGPNEVETKQLVEFLRTAVRDKGPVVFSKARLLALRARIPAAEGYENGSDEDIIKFYRDLHISLCVTSDVLADRPTTVLRKLVRGHPDTFALVKEIGTYKVYSFNADASSDLHRDSMAAKH